MYPTQPKPFRKWLIAERERLGIKDTQLADRAGIPLPFELERDDERPSNSGQRARPSPRSTTFRRDARDAPPDTASRPGGAMTQPKNAHGHPAAPGEGPFLTVCQNGKRGGT